MKAETINLQIVVNLGNYESLRLGAEYTPDKGQSVEDVMLEADAELRNAAAAIINARKQPAPAPAQQTEREPLAFSSPKLQKIIKRIEAGVKLDEVLKYYAPDEQAMAALIAAVSIN